MFIMYWRWHPLEITLPATINEFAKGKVKFSLVCRLKREEKARRRIKKRSGSRREEDHLDGKRRGKIHH